MPSWNEATAAQQKIDRHLLYRWYLDNREAAQGYRGARSIKDACKVLEQLKPNETGDHPLDAVQYDKVAREVQHAGRGKEPHDLKKRSSALMDAIRAAESVSSALFPEQRVVQVAPPELAADPQLASRYFATDFLEKHAVHYSGDLSEAKTQIIKKAREKSRERLEKGGITRSTVAALDTRQKTKLEKELEARQAEFQKIHDGPNAVDPLTVLYVTQQRYSFMSFEGLEDPRLKNLSFEPAIQNEYLVFGVRRERVGTSDCYRVSHLEFTCRNPEQILETHTDAGHPGAFVQR